MTSCIKEQTTDRLSQFGKEQISVYINAVISLFDRYPMDLNASKQYQNLLFQNMWFGISVQIAYTSQTTAM